jgi:hypothetical protein
MFEKLRFRMCTTVAGKLISIADLAIDEAERLARQRQIYTYDEAARIAKRELLAEIEKREVSRSQ